MVDYSLSGRLKSFSLDDCGLCIPTFPSPPSQPQGPDRVRYFCTLVEKEIPLIAKRYLGNQSGGSYTWLVFVFLSESPGTKVELTSWRGQVQSPRDIPKESKDNAYYIQDEAIRQPERHLPDQQKSGLILIICVCYNSGKDDPN